MTNLYTLDHSCITGYLRNYGPIKQNFCLLPHNNTSRPLIVPQEYLIHFDDFLLPCNIPTRIVKPLTVIKHLVPSPLDDKDKTYITALYKQTYSFNELLFIAAKTISFMVQAEQQTEHKSHSSTMKNNPNKLSSVLNNRTFRDITNLLDPSKRNPSDFLLPCNIPTQIVKPLAVIKHLVSSPLDDKDRTYYTALYKQTYSYNELLFISAKTISFMVQAEQSTEHKSHASPIKNTPDKFSSVLNHRTLRDITNLLEPYKRNSSETPITTLTHILHCYDRTHKLLQTLDLDSQGITQSSQRIEFNLLWNL